MNQSNTYQSKYHSTLIVVAFITVIFIWTTTPVAIKWSGEGVSYLFGILVRMGIGAIVALILVLLKYKTLPMSTAARKMYIASAFGIFGGMMPAYWAAQHISSGLISVIFGLSPMVTGYFAWRFSLEQRFSRIKILGSVTSLLGLLVIFYKGFSSDEMYVLGILVMLTAVILHSASAVWIKSLNISMSPLSLVAGGLLFSMPLFMTVYLIFAPPLVAAIPLKAIWSILYLGVVGSVIGFMSYYFLLKHLAASSVVLITLITPISALWLGHAVNNEDITLSVYIGTAFVLIGLLLHQGEGLLSRKIWGKRKQYSG
ncbi:Permease of the drug/metabolite transporter (DMT) superfamily [hydrothermal vent metagenome]|uniref:Permease of the drug/metabolite transporter (DMT) superfamily n=1 Tax=hydrothermal vent metagenome TaxID=652676 RepID=A0A3B0WVH6_9ZZZZ